MTEEVKMIKTRINGKWDLLLPEHRAVRPEWDIKNGGWEPERLDAMHKIISSMQTRYSKFDTPRQPIVLDIGAEEGDMPALFATWGAKVFMVEPNMRVWSNIRAIWEGNTLTPYGWFTGFAGPETKSFPEYTAKVTTKDGWPLCAYDTVQAEHGFDHLAESAHWINQIRIDDLLFVRNGIMPDIITVDVEGSEYEVMKGAERVLTEGSPVVFVSVHPEFMFHNHDDYEAHFHNYMHKMGYTKKWLAYDHEHHWMYTKVEK